MAGLDNLAIVVRIGMSLTPNAQCRLAGYQTGWFIADDVDFGLDNKSLGSDSEEIDSNNVDFDILKIKKDIDPCTPQLLSACCQNGGYSSAEIHYVQTFYRTETGEGSNPGGVSPIFIARFENIGVVNWELEGNETNHPKETIKLRYQSIAVGWVNQKDGTVIGKGWTKVDGSGTSAKPTQSGEPWDYFFKARGRLG
jgi:type VI protein secretion system component Hcp